MSANKSQICDEIASCITKKYGIDETVVADFKTMILESLSPYYLYSVKPGSGGKAKRKAKGPKKPRKTSAYNVYVKEKMQEPDIKATPQKEKMAKIGAMWKQLDDAGKAPFKVKADAVNAANPALQPGAAEAAAAAAPVAAAPVAAAPVAAAPVAAAPVATAPVAATV